MIAQNKINPCRPGHGASCAFCCGSHNYTFQPDLIEEIFEKRDSEHSVCRSSRHPEESDNQKLVKEGMQCTHVGISGSEPGIVCCLSYNDNEKPPEFRSFFKGTCKNFYCVAWNELTAKQILFAAELMGDWYYYSLLINCIEILMDLCSEYEYPSDMPGSVLEELKLELVNKLNEDDLI
ncbi:MAG TPA: hypothetical protein PK514_13805 [Spirochaetota bacterium]|nr:hypothetical protein [Spirochaetota bacterium]